MKKKLRRLHLDRETLRKLTPERLDAVAGGVPTDSDSYAFSCDPAAASRPQSICNSCHPLQTYCC